MLALHTVPGPPSTWLSTVAVGMSTAGRRCPRPAAARFIIRRSRQQPAASRIALVVFHLTSRRLADLAAPRLLRRRPGADHRTAVGPQDEARRAAAAARRSARRHPLRPARARGRRQARRQLGARQRAGGRPARRGIARSAPHRGGAARQLRDRRPRRAAPARALPQHARHHRLGGAAARPARHGHRHDRDLRRAAAPAPAATRRSSRTASRWRSTTPPSACSSPFRR